METIKKDNQTMYYMDGRLLLTITKLGDNHFVTENSGYKIEGKITIIDEYRTEIEIIQHKKKDKRGYWRNNKILLNHNTNWFSYILQEYGFIRKAIPMTIGG